MKNFKACFRPGLLHFAFLLPCFLLPSRFAGAAPASVAAKSGGAAAKIAGIPTVVRGDLVDMESGDQAQSGDSVTPILAALKAYPRARRIRLTWELHMMIQVDDVQFLYDRSKQTLTVYARYGGEGPPGTAAVQFSHVRVSVLQALVKSHPEGIYSGDEVSAKIGKRHNNDADLWGGFQFLYQPRYGCRFRVVKAQHKIALLPASSFPASSFPALGCIPVGKLFGFVPLPQVTSPQEA